MVRPSALHHLIVKLAIVVRDVGKVVDKIMLPAETCQQIISE